MLSPEHETMVTNQLCLNVMQLCEAVHSTCRNTSADQFLIFQIKLLK